MNQRGGGNERDRMQQSYATHFRTEQQLEQTACDNLVQQSVKSMETQFKDSRTSTFVYLSDSGIMRYDSVINCAVSRLNAMKGVKASHQTREPTFSNDCVSEGIRIQYTPPK
jgi:hypothetical protein